VDWNNFSPVAGYRDARYASTTGGLPGVPKPDHAEGMAAFDFFPKMAQGIHRHNMHQLERWIDFSHLHTALDVGGGAGNLAEVLRQDYNITCITLTRDNAQNVGWFYDLPFNERAAARHNLPIISSGIRRQPFPDLSIDFFHSRSAVPLSLDEEVNAGMLLDWDRMLRPGGYVALLSITTDFLLPYNGRTSNSSEHNKLSGFAHTLSHVAHKVGWEAICPVSGCVFRRALPVHRPENGDSKDDSAMMLTGDYHVRLFRKPMR